MTRRSTAAKPRRKPDHVGLSLRNELGTLACALDAVRIVASAIAHHATESERDRREGPAACVAVVELVLARLGLTDRVLAGDANARVLLALHNHVPLDGPAGARVVDVILPISRPRRSARAAEKAQ